MTSILLIIAFCSFLVLLVVVGLKLIDRADHNFKRELEHRAYVERMKWYNEIRDKPEE